MSVIKSTNWIRVELHVAWLGHTLPRVHLLDTSPQVIPYLVQTYLSESMRVLGPVWWHAGAPYGLFPLPWATVPAPVSVGPTGSTPQFVLIPSPSDLRVCSPFGRRCSGSQRMVSSKTGCSPTLHAWVVLWETHQITYKGKNNTWCLWGTHMTWRFDPRMFGGFICCQLDQGVDQTVTSV